MSSQIINEVRKGFYLDSVALMRISRSIVDMHGVETAAVMMGSSSNREIMTNAGLLNDVGQTAESGDLIIAVLANDMESAEMALTQSRALLDEPRSNTTDENNWQPRTLRAAVKLAPDSSLALISVPGDFAVAEARKAIRRGLHAMIFSDNIPISDEVALKHEARELGKLVMGPDCGTSIINGVPLAFANKLPRGDIGIIGASGTGIQEISCLIAQYGGGISHAIGVGGRDLKTEVGGISTLMALDALDADSLTKHIVIVSKPPPAAMITKVLQRVGESDKPFTICFIGAKALTMPDNATQAFSLKAAAQSAMRLSIDDVATDDAAIDNAVTEAINLIEGKNRVMGLFSGGTLCAEAQVIFHSSNETVTSNAPIPGVPLLTDVNDCHLLLDLGADEYTRGKPHPMIDPTVRDETLIKAMGSDNVGLILIDVVLGFGAHDDPAGHLAGVITNHRNDNGSDKGPAIVASVTGTEADPQVRSTQISKLTAIGVHVAPTNADAASWALGAIRSTTQGL